MKKLFSYAILTAGTLAGTTSAAVAGELNLTISNGRVTLVASDVPVRQILAEWARIGQTKIVNGDKMMGPPLTLELHDVPEAKALETVLRTAAGYVVAPRMAGRTGSSSFDTIVILATSRPPAVTAATPMPFSPSRANAQPMMPPVDEDDEPDEVAPPPGLGTVGSPFPGPMPRNPQGNMPQGPQGPLTSPRPGQLPQAAPGQVNPYTPQYPPGANPAQTPATMPGMPPRPGGGGGGN